MRLLTQRQIKDTKKKRSEEMRLASIKVQEALIEKTSRINQLDASYELKKEELIKKYSEEVKEYKRQLTELDYEVQKLQKLKREALEPLDAFEKELNLKRQNQDIEADRLKQEKKRLLELDESINKESYRLNKVSCDIEERLVGLATREKNIELSEKNISENEKLLKEARQILNDEYDKFREDIAESKDTLRQERAELKALHINLDEKKKELENGWIKLNSERAKIDSTIKELKNKGLWEK